MGERELNKRKKNVIQPFATPAMAGGLFSVDRNYFFRMGSYDEKMKVCAHVHTIIAYSHMKISFPLRRFGVVIIWKCHFVYGNVVDVWKLHHVLMSAIYFARVRPTHFRAVLAR